MAGYVISMIRDRVCLGGNFGVILVRVCEQVFKPIPNIYLVFEKK